MELLTLLSGLSGGMFRMLPEILTWLDKQEERKHELALLAANTDADRVRAELKAGQTQLEGDIQLDMSTLDAIRATAVSQSEMAMAAGGFWLKVNASVRPVLTYWWCLILYTATTCLKGYVLIQSQAPPSELLDSLWGADEKAICASLFMFWFVDRALKWKSQNRQ